MRSFDPLDFRAVLGRQILRGLRENETRWARSSRCVRSTGDLFGPIKACLLTSQGPRLALAEP
jgi:hypothetical protein